MRNHSHSDHGWINTGGKRDSKFRIRPQEAQSTQPDRNDSEQKPGDDIRRDKAAAFDGERALPMLLVGEHAGNQSDRRDNAEIECDLSVEQTAMMSRYSS